MALLLVAVVRCLQRHMGVSAFDCSPPFKRCTCTTACNLLSTTYCLQMCPCLLPGGKQKGGAAKSKASEAEVEVSDFDLQPVEK